MKKFGFERMKNYDKKIIVLRNTICNTFLRYNGTDLEFNAWRSMRIWTVSELKAWKIMMIRSLCVRNKVCMKLCKVCMRQVPINFWQLYFILSSVSSFLPDCCCRGKVLFWRLVDVSLLLVKCGYWWEIINYVQMWNFYLKPSGRVIVNLSVQWSNTDLGLIVCCFGLFRCTNYRGTVHFAAFECTRSQFWR